MHSVCISFASPVLNFDNSSSLSYLSVAFLSIIFHFKTEICPIRRSLSSPVSIYESSGAVFSVDSYSDLIQQIPEVCRSLGFSLDNIGAHNLNYLDSGSLSTSHIIETHLLQFRIASRATKWELSWDMLSVVTIVRLSFSPAVCLVLEKWRSFATLIRLMNIVLIYACR